MSNRGVEPNAIGSMVPPFGGGAGGGGGGGVTWPLLAPDGSVGAPSYSWASNPTTGLYHPATADTMSFAAGGTEVARVTAPGGLLPQLRVAPGTVAAPSYGFIGAPGGIWPISTVSLGFALDQTISWLAFTRVSGHVYALDQLGSAGGIGLRATSVGSGTFLNSRISNQAAPAVDISQVSAQPFASNALVQSHTRITSVLLQTGTAAFASLRINQVQTSLGSGLQRFVSGAIGGTEVFAVASDAVMPGQVQAAGGSVTRPGLSFLGSGISTGVYLDLSGDTQLAFSCDNTAMFFAEAAGARVAPNVDAAYTLGALGLRWLNLYAVTTTIGDIVMRDPHPGKKSLDQVAHWRLVEGLDTIHLYNIRTGKKFAMVLEAEAMDDADRDIISRDRLEAGWPSA